MNAHIMSTTQRQAALIAGIAIVAMTIAAVLATELTIGELVVENDAAATLNNIMESKMKYRLGVFSWLIILICDVIAAWGLYVFFRITNKDLSLLAAWLRLAYAAMLAVCIFNLVYVHMLIGQTGPSTADSTVKLGEKVMFYLEAFDMMFSVSLIVFGIHIILLGYLSLKSEYVPRMFGIVLIIGFGGYTIPNISNLIFPEYNDFMKVIALIFILPMLGEVALGIWLLVKGINKKEISFSGE
jgi:hypothetical protein